MGAFPEFLIGSKRKDKMPVNFIQPSLRFAHRACLAGASRLRNFYYRALGVKIHGYVWIRAIEIPRNWSDITLESNVALDRGTILLCSGPRKADKLVIKSGTYVNRYTIFDAHQHLEIGKNCMIGPHCYITDADHSKIAGKPIVLQNMQPGPVIIEDGVWLGANVVVLPGVKISTEAVIGAGSVVTCDIARGAIAVGIPARQIGIRK